MHSIKDQIYQKFPKQLNLLVNMTWFGPQFDNDEYAKFQKFTQSNHIDNIFLLASEDPCFFNKDETNDLIEESKAKNSFLLGHFDTTYNFNFHSTVIGDLFPNYSNNDLMLQDPIYIFLNYNRKPREHRKKFVSLLDKNQLSSLGIITLGNDRNLGESIEEYKDGNWGMSNEYGIPHDISSLGRAEHWQNHFLTVVSETDFEDHLWTFVTEKTWKPIIGLRPFVINGQLEIYRYLRKHGFKTFNHYWPHINIETSNIDDIHKNICKLIAWLKTQDLKQLYNDMLPDLLYNQHRFKEFGVEQKHRMHNLFEDK